MDTFALMLGWAGIYGPTALGAIGSIIGCALRRAGCLRCDAGCGKRVWSFYRAVRTAIVADHLRDCRHVHAQSGSHGGVGTGFIRGGNPLWAGAAGQRRLPRARVVHRQSWRPRRSRKYSVFLPHRPRSLKVLPYSPSFSRWSSLAAFQQRVAKGRVTKWKTKITKHPASNN